MDRAAHLLARPLGAVVAVAPDCPRRTAVVGAGWAGLAAAVQAVQHGDRVTVFEMAHQPGGRARTVKTAAGLFDNGQHLLIGAYTATLALMRHVGADPDTLLLRRPLALTTPDGHGLVLPAGKAVPAFVRGVLSVADWPRRHRVALLAAAAGWGLRGFHCAPGLAVSGLCRHLPDRLQRELIEPLCLAALNTPMHEASAQVFLRALRDALFSGPGGADLLLPRAPLSALLPEPAWRWLSAAGASCQGGHRVQALAPLGQGWQVDGQAFDQVVLACSATEAVRLSSSVNPGWAATAAALRYEPIITAYLHDDGLRLPSPMLALPAGARAPAQFVFDLGALHASAPAATGIYAFVASGAASWLSGGLQASGRAVLQQAREVFTGAFCGPEAAVLRHLAAERRATFACTPGLRRPAMSIAPGLAAAGDYVAGPYPATLEGAVRSGLAAACHLKSRDRPEAGIDRPNLEPRSRTPFRHAK